MSAIHPDLSAVLDVVEIQSHGRYVLLGEACQLSATSPGEAIDLPQRLEGALYARLYCRPCGDAVPADVVSRRDHVAALSAANSGEGTWEPGWAIGGARDDRVAVSKDGCTFWAPADRVRRGGPDGSGSVGRVLVPKERRHLQPGFYYALGNADADETPRPIVRFSWHLTAEGAAPFVAAVCETLNARGLPFWVKVLSDPGAYVRANAGYLYLDRRRYGQLGDALVEVHDRVAAWLRPPVPLFTRALAPGLGVSEAPHGISFGQCRCRLVAQGLWNAFRQGDGTPQARAAALASAFLQAGLDPRRPHLEPGSADHYSFGPSRRP
jgi:hypothetical protein